jgi:hypothetical protein
VWNFEWLLTLKMEWAMLSETSENLHNLRGSFINSEVLIAHHTFLCLFSNFSFVLSTFLSGSFSSFPHSLFISSFLFSFSLVWPCTLHS